VSETAFLELRDVSKYFKTPFGMLHAVDHVNLSIKKGTTLGIVGESGCGKSTLGRVALRMLEASGGEIFYNGEDILKFNKSEMSRIRRKLQLIFQDPYSSLNPRMSVCETISDPIRINGLHNSTAEINRNVEELMETVGLDLRFTDSYPHELDGGRRQRVGIARALSVNPEFIVCDEPVSALDVSIQAQILNLLMDLQDQKSLTYMFITHDLSVVKHISDEIAVMYLGMCVERAPSRELFINPLHPYTKGLLAAIPEPNLKSRNKQAVIIPGEVVNPIEPAPGCRFVTRCAYASPKCSGENIPLQEVSPGHFLACTLYN
jgi:peptide/nickel transport system ATP-binding protein